MRPSAMPESALLRGYGLDPDTLELIDRRLQVGPDGRP